MAVAVVDWVTRHCDGVEGEGVEVEGEVWWNLWSALSQHAVSLSWSHDRTPAFWKRKGTHKTMKEHVATLWKRNHSDQDVIAKVHMRLMLASFNKPGNRSTICLLPVLQAAINLRSSGDVSHKVMRRSRTRRGKCKEPLRYLFIASIEQPIEQPVSNIQPSPTIQAPSKISIAG
ncbi:uncharacterized protein MYCGRDRAFT_88614 [Zymoseptoria tritici IPO323]|uniref:Uncharacterized protein n=1 Tax=Zymoseptoria tritici (strain CBS 115943 / IPO323) TaxID=336722 RepID=F9WXE2_ZYMTI|nr:uncharacterized protein MYCGRDRAFT_88614 [Zymoseptoria tritici IPO323]EGP92771.1 hypothetical protein MYCGRDRAFT_88614 [Zymoseptoria tritici IPO323]